MANKKQKIFFIVFLFLFLIPKTSFGAKLGLGLVESETQCLTLLGETHNNRCVNKGDDWEQFRIRSVASKVCCIQNPCYGEDNKVTQCTAENTPPPKQETPSENTCTDPSNTDCTVNDFLKGKPSLTSAECRNLYDGSPTPRGPHLKKEQCGDQKKPYLIGNIGDSSLPSVCCAEREIPKTPSSRTSFNANLQYSLLEKIPGISGTQFNLTEYIAAIYKLGIWIVGICALFMFTLGAFLYLLSAGNTSKMGSGKDIMQDALIGLVLALASYLILYVINPDLLKLKLSSLSLSSQGAQEQAASPTSVSIPVPGDMKSAAAQILSNGKITLATNGSCRSESGPVTPRKNMEDIAAGKSMDGCYSGCNAPNAKPCNLRINPSENMLDAILIVSQKYAISITSFSGGSHSKTSRHYSGRATDLTSGNKSDWPGIVAEFKKNGASQAFCDKNGNQVSCDSADHIHVGY